MSDTIKPEAVTPEMLTYLDDLRESGVTNMFWAGTYLRKEFDLETTESHEVLSYWMNSFGAENR